MFRQRTGSVVCASCGSLVGVNDDTCYSCGRRNPGLWGFGPLLRRFGNDLGFTNVIVYGCAGLYTLSLILTVMTEIVVTTRIGHGWYALLGTPQWPLLRNIFLFVWIFAPALFARGEREES